MKRNHIWIHAAIISITTLIAYSKIFYAGFISWDDMDYVLAPDIQSINFEHFKSWWSEFYLGNYQPLPVFSYAIDHWLGGQDPLAYHLQSLAWHIACSILVYFLMLRLKQRPTAALFVALLFALHPVQTESVAWIAARNKVMNGFFFLAALQFYTGYVREQKKTKLILVYLCGTLAYLCKLTAVMLPFALFAMDIWMDRSFRGKKVWLEKLPLVLLALPIGLITLQAQKEVGFLDLHPEFTTIHTFLFAGYAYTTYLIHLLFPAELSVLYPYPAETGIIHIVYTAVAAGILVLGVYAWKKRWRVLAGGILFYTVNIAIVLQFVQFGELLMADRYLYIACLGVWFPVVFYLFHWLDKKGKTMPAMIGGAAVCLLFLVATFRRNDVWMNELSFWLPIAAKYPDSPIAQYSLGAAYLKTGEITAAEEPIDKAISLSPGNYKAWYNKGILALRQKKTATALQALSRAVSLNPYPKALFTRALIYQQSGQYELALKDIEPVLDIEPENARAHFIKADCLEQRNDLRGAVAEYSLAVNYEPAEPMFYMRRAITFAKTKQFPAALHDLDLAIRLKPASGEYWYWRGIVKYNTGQNPCADLEEAVERNFTEARQALKQICVR